jgi:FkbM family methyltransferase
MLNTRQKIFLARCVYKVLHGVRRLTRRGDRAVVRRGGIVWDLNLAEGIDFSIYLLGAFERSTVSAYSQNIRGGHVVLDVGANIGAHTLRFARLVGPQGLVVAFEPTHYAYTKLERNVSLNPELAPRVRLEQIMLADARQSELTPHLYSQWPLRSDVPAQHASHRGVLADTTGAHVETLDDYVQRRNLARVDFLKIDVDGHECRVLRGAARLLTTRQPIILIELAPQVLNEAGESLAGLVEILKSAGYRFLRIPGLTPLPEKADALAQLIPAGGGINVICRAR